MIVYKYSNFSIELQGLVESPSFCRRGVVRSLHCERIRLSHDQLHAWCNAHQPCGLVDHEVSLAPHQYFIGDLPIRAFISIYRCQLELKRHNTNLVRISLWCHCPPHQTQGADFKLRLLYNAIGMQMVWQYVLSVQAYCHFVPLWPLSEQFFKKYWRLSLF